MTPTARFLCGDVRDQLATLPAASVDCCITSPPYFGLRDYGVPASVWGGDPACDHVWDEQDVTAETTPNARWQHAEGGDGHNRWANAGTHPDQARTFATRTLGTCAACGAWRGALGMEPTPALYVAHLVDVFRAVRRVLKPTGTLWLNLGDSYASGMRSSYDSDRKYGGARASDKRPPTPPGLKPKDLIGVPWRVAFALQDDGWWLRSDIIWAKENPMPESVTDRPTRSHEYVFLLAASERYTYDAAAIAEAATHAGRVVAYDGSQKNTDHQNRTYPGATPRDITVKDTRNKRDVWTVNTQPFPGAHFAVFPEALVEPMVLAGCPVGGTVLDPFSGSGTTAAVALRLGRHAIGIDLNPAYVAMAERRARQIGLALEVTP